jgi:hypothetical protein
MIFRYWSSVKAFIVVVRTPPLRAERKEERRVGLIIRGLADEHHVVVAQQEEHLLDQAAFFP